MYHDSAGGTYLNYGCSTGCTRGNINNTIMNSTFSAIMCEISEGSADVTVMNPRQYCSATSSDEPWLYGGRTTDVRIINPHWHNHTTTSSFLVGGDYDDEDGNIIVNPVLSGTVNSFRTIGKGWSVVQQFQSPASPLITFASTNRTSKAPTQVLALRTTVWFSDTSVSFGSIPIHAEILDIEVQVLTAFNATTTNTLSVGVTGVPAHFVNAEPVGTTGKKSPALTNLGYQSAVRPLIATYTQSGTAATTGVARVIVTYVPSDSSPLQ
jgi:hypothetical protein